MEEYITVKELSSRIKFSKQTIYNLIYENVFVLGKHYLKPRPKKILFKWSAIEAWMIESSNPSEKIHPAESVQPIQAEENITRCLPDTKPVSSIRI